MNPEKFDPMDPKYERVSKREKLKKEKAIESKERLKKKVLVIEDNDEYREAANRFFHLDNTEEVELTFAKDLEEANEKLNSEAYDIIISDLFFPQKTGSNNKEAGIEIAWKIMHECEKKYKSKESKPGLSKEDFKELVNMMRELQLILRKECGEEYDEVVASHGFKGIEGYFFDNKEVKKIETEIDKIMCKTLLQSFEVTQTAFDLGAGDEEYQPLGWEIIQEAKKRKIKYLLISGGAHSGYGSGIQNMLSNRGGGKTSMLDEDGKPYDNRDEINKKTEFIIGYKKNPETWKTATQFLIKEK